MNIEQATKRVEELTDLAMASGDELQRVSASIGFIKISSYSRADVMRGIAEKVLPNQWEWEVAEAINGKCYLFVRHTG